MQRGVRDGVLACQAVCQRRVRCALQPGDQAVSNAGNHQGKKHQQGVVAPSSLFTFITIIIAHGELLLATAWGLYHLQPYVRDSAPACKAVR